MIAAQSAMADLRIVRVCPHKLHIMQSLRIICNNAIYAAVA